MPAHSTYVITLNDPVNGFFNFNATQNGVNLGNFQISGDNGHQSTTFVLINQDTHATAPSNTLWGTSSNTGPVGSVPTFSDDQWLNGGQTVFPPNGGFVDKDCIIIINGSMTMTFPVAVLTGTPPTTPTVQPVVEQLAQNLGPGQITFSKIVGTGAPRIDASKPCCVHPDTMVMNDAGEKPIRALKEGDVVIDLKGNAVPISFNIQGVIEKKFINIPVNSLGKNMPSRDLIIRGEHPIMFKGKEIMPKTLMKRKHGEQLMNINLEKAEHVWSLCTKERTFIMMNNLPVATWSETEWEAYERRNPNLFWIQH